MNNYLMKMIFEMDSLQKKVDEYGTMSLRMKGITCLCLLVDFLCAKKGDGIIVMLTLIALVVFLVIDVMSLKKKQQYEIKLEQLKIETQEIMNYKAHKVHYPIVFYMVIATAMIVWLIKIC